MNYLFTGTELYRCTLYFDNNTTYVAETNSEIGHYITAVDPNGNEAITAGNPIGIITANGCTVQIQDINNLLLPSNQSSPYFRYMRNGVKMHVEISYDDGATYEDYFIGYSTNWDTGYSQSMSDIAEITGMDRIQYWGNKKIPKLPVYSGIKVSKLLKYIFDSIGITEFTIDSRLDKTIKLSITKGTYIKDALNDILQALVARLILDRDESVKIVPATEGYGNYYSATQLGTEYIEKITSSYNNDNNYNGVKITFSDNGKNGLDNVYISDNIKIAKGTSTLTTLSFSNRALSIDAVYIEHPAKAVKDGLYVDVDIDISSYEAGQDSIDITLANNTGVSVDGCNIIIQAQSVKTNERTSIAKTSGVDSDIKVSNYLEIESNTLQDQDDADKAAEHMADYLSKTTKVVIVDTLLSPKIKVGDLIEIKDQGDEFNGTYKIISDETTHEAAGSYSKRLTLIKGYITADTVLDENFILM
jgi:hypothetical protein